MCGIAGVFGSADSISAVAAMSDAIRHRGPDDSGFEELTSSSGTVAGAFGHRRLAIVDLSPAGHGPMFSVDGTICLAFNGEIYNYEALMRELKAEGCQFRSHCDTEVIVAGWQRHGPSFLERLRGMFAFALWDSRRDRGYLVRDTFGIKPLYIATVGGDVLFASEVRSLLASGRIERKLSGEGLRSYLASGSVAEPLTIIEGIRTVPAGSVIEVRWADGRATLGNAAAFGAPFARDEADFNPHPRCHIHRIRDALRESVAYHLVSDVPVGVFLSGGMDSSAIAGLASEVSETRLESFTVTFKEADYTEAEPARQAARRFGTRHHEVPLSGEDLLGTLPDVFAAMDQPSLDGFNTFVVSRAVRDFGLKVVLSGLGGDELFGGYPSFHRARYIEKIWNLPGGIRRIGAAGFDRLGGIRASRISSMLNQDDPSLAAYVASRTLFGSRQIAHLVEAHSRDRTPLMSPALEDLSGLSLMQQVSFFELTGYMRNTLLRDSDVFSMAHGLELRVPMVDVEVVRVAQNAAAAVGIRRGETKPLLLEAVRDLIPESAFNRPKRGFTLPFENWMRKELYAEVESVLGGATAEGLGLRSEAVREVWQSFQEKRPGVNWSRPWALYTLLKWAEQNDISLNPVAFATPAVASDPSASGTQAIFAGRFPDA